MSLVFLSHLGLLVYHSQASKPTVVCWRRRVLATVGFLHWQLSHSYNCLPPASNLSLGGPGLLPSGRSNQRAEARQQRISQQVTEEQWPEVGWPEFKSGLSHTSSGNSHDFWFGCQDLQMKLDKRKNWHWLLPLGKDCCIFFQWTSQATVTTSL